MGVILFIVALLLVIMVHEAGHFIAAKKLGFKATKFFVGFGPTLWSTTKGETEYGIKAIPAGGFVKILGMNPYEEVAPEDQSRSYPNRPRWQRALVILGGPITHWPLAILVLALGYMAFGEPIATNRVDAVSQMVGNEVAPAAEAGLKRDDRIVSVDGTPTEDWEDVRNFIRDHPGERVTFTVERDGRTIEVTTALGNAVMTPDGEVLDYAPSGEEVRDPVGSEELVGFLGVSPQADVDRAGPVEAFGRGATRAGEMTGDAVTGIGGFFASFFNGDFFESFGDGGRPEGTGIVGIGNAANQTVEGGHWQFFTELMAGLTIFIGLMNLLPLVPLDGGHLAVIGWESVTGNRVDMRKLIPFAAAVIMFFLVLSVVFLYYDIVAPPDLGL